MLTAFLGYAGDTMHSALRLEWKFDVDRMLQDLAIAERQGADHLHHGRYHDGGWSAIPLVSMHGRVDAAALRWSGPRVRSGFARTPILDQCPYLSEIIERFQCDKQRIRLMRLAPGARIHDHSDGIYWSWELGHTARFHVPIVTHEDVHFFVDNVRVRMQPGELWYCDFSKVHRVANESPIARVHLVMDLSMNRWLRSLFPSEPMADRARNLIRHSYYRSGAAGIVARMHKREKRIRVVQD